MEPGCSPRTAALALSSIEALAVSATPSTVAAIDLERGFEVVRSKAAGPTEGVFGAGSTIWRGEAPTHLSQLFSVQRAGRLPFVSRDPSGYGSRNEFRRKLQTLYSF